MRPAAVRSYRFGSFEVNPSARLLTNDGKPVAVTPRVFELLLYFTRHPGRLLTKEELMKSIWGDLAVEDGNLTQSVFLLRKALSGRAGGLIVTVPGRGYQFTGEVEEIAIEEPVPVQLETQPKAEPAPERTVERESTARRNALAYLAVSVVAMATIALLMLLRAKPQKTIPLPHLVATNSSDSYPLTYLSLSPDGKYLAYTSPQSFTIQTLNSNDTRTIPMAAGESPVRLSWYPDGTRLLVIKRMHDSFLLSVFSILSGKMTPLKESANAFSVSADGSRIAYSVNLTEIWLMDANGDNARRILQLSPGHKLYPLFWSPDSRRVWFAHVQWNKRQETITLESCDLNGAAQTVALTENRASSFLLLPGGRLIYARREGPQEFTNLWELAVNSTTGNAAGVPHQITNWTNFTISQLSSTIDGKRVAFLNGSWHDTVMIGDLKSSIGGMQMLNARRLTNNQGGDDAPAFWTDDDRSVVFESNRNGRSQIFRQRLDQTAAELLSQDSAEAQNPSYGGRWIYYHSSPAGVSFVWDQPFSLRRIPVGGGLSSEVKKGVGFEIACSFARPEICVLGQLKDRVMTFYRFDHVQGQGAEVGRLAHDSHLSPSFAVSPDGTEVAAVDSKGAGNWIRRFPLHGGPCSAVEVRGRKELTSLYWAQDGKGWFVASVTAGNGMYLLHATLRGDSEILYEQQGDGRDTWGIPSHNGKQIAFMHESIAKNAWLIDDF